MNTETGQIKDLAELTEKELRKGKWVEFPNKETLNRFVAMPEPERVKQYAAHGWTKSTIKPPEAKDRRKAKRRAQKLARRRNRQ